MKKILYILTLLLISVIAMGQDTILMKNGAGDLMSFNGTLLRYITGESVTPLSGYVSNDSVEIILIQDFDWATPQENPTTAYCETGMTHGGSIGSVHWDSTNTKYIAFETLEAGDIVMRSDADSLQCCIEANDPNDDGYGNLGTGIIWREDLNAAGTDRDTVAVSFNVWLPADFEIGDGAKFNGVTGDGDQRYSAVMLNPYYAISDSIQLIDYSWGYEFDYSPNPDHNYGTPGDDVGNRPMEMPKGRWVNFTQIKYIGTTDSYDGLSVLFIDGVKVNHNGGIMFNNSAGTTIGWEQLNIETHFGGSTVAYNSPKNQSSWFDDFVVWKYVDGYSYDMLSVPTFGDTIALPEVTGWREKSIDPSN